MMTAWKRRLTAAFVAAAAAAVGAVAKAAPADAASATADFNYNCAVHAQQPILWAGGDISGAGTLYCDAPMPYMMLDLRIAKNGVEMGSSYTWNEATGDQVIGLNSYFFCDETAAYTLKADAYVIFPGGTVPPALWMDTESSPVTFWCYRG